MQKVKSICEGIDCLNIYYFDLIVKVAFALENLWKAGCTLHVLLVLQPGPILPLQISSFCEEKVQIS